MIIKKKNNITLEIGTFDRTKRGFVITDHNSKGDIVVLPLGVRYKQVKQTFCIMTKYSISNKNFYEKGG